MDGSNQEVLDRLLNQPSPASTFEAMSVGSVSKTTFHQMLPAFAIKLGSLGIGLSTRSIQESLIAMTFKAAARFGSGTELPQLATQTNPFFGHVFPAQAHRMQPPWPHYLTSLSSEADHELRAALICLLTAALAAQGAAAIIGEPNGGWFWLPPWSLWQRWATQGFNNAARLKRRIRDL